MKPQHTPGPWVFWKVTLPFLGWEILDSTKKRNGIARLPATRSEDEANARLIAAAPELLDALRKCELQHLPTPLLCEVRAVLIKAGVSVSG